MSFGEIAPDAGPRDDRYPIRLFPQPSLLVALKDILAGDDEEHAILLHNFILYLIMGKEGIAGASRRRPDRTGQRTEVRRTNHFRHGLDLKTRWSIVFMNGSPRVSMLNSLWAATNPHVVVDCKHTRPTAHEALDATSFASFLVRS